MGTWRLVERGSGRPVVDRLQIADGYWSRLAGLQLRPRPAPRSGLLLVPCSSIHTFLMRFAIDAIMLDRDGMVLEVRRDVRPWRVLIPHRSTFGILELPSTREPVEIVSGMILRIERLSGPSKISRRLTPWLLEGR